MTRTLTLILSTWLLAMPASAATPGLTLQLEDGARTLDAAQLLARSDARGLKLARDPFYGPDGPTYRVVPLTELIHPAKVPAHATVQFRAADGFVATIPADAVLNIGGNRPIAQIAVEDPAHPWPAVPRRGKASAGPFALVWTGPGAQKVWSERWPYQIVEIAVVQAPAAQWPQLALDTAANAKVQRGQQVFITQCLVCHQFAGAGAARVGPDLNQPMSPTQYFTPQILRQYLRDPASVRDWPGRQMNGFSREMLPDQDLDALLAFLGYRAVKPALTR